MRKIKLADHLTDEELAELMELSENKQQFRRWQAIFLIQTQGLSSAQVAEIVKVSADTVIQWVFYIIIKENSRLYLKGAEDAGDAI